MKRDYRKKGTWDGPKRVARMEADEACRQRIPARYAEAREKFLNRQRDGRGLKRQYIPGLEGYVLTPYFRKLVRTRRRRNKVARNSRRINYGTTR